jgi:hypothetical protein
MLNDIVEENFDAELTSHYALRIPYGCAHVPRPRAGRCRYVGGEAGFEKLKALQGE